MLRRFLNAEPRTATSPRRNKLKVPVSLGAELLDWINDRVGSGERFASVSHASERCG